MTRSWLRPCGANTMTLTEAAWLAGFFDGEGSLSRYMSGRNRNYPSWVISVPNTNLAALKRCAAYTGAGRINPKKVKPRHQPQWQWRVDRQRDIEAVCRQMLPYLIIKRRAVESFLSEWIDVP
jgi:hypothetical protein